MWHGMESIMPERTDCQLSRRKPANVICFNCESSDTELVEPEFLLLPNASIYRCRHCGLFDWVNLPAGKLA